MFNIKSDASCGQLRTKHGLSKETIKQKTSVKLEIKSKFRWDHRNLSNQLQFTGSPKQHDGMQKMARYVSLKKEFLKFQSLACVTDWKV